MVPQASYQFLMVAKKKIKYNFTNQKCQVLTDDEPKDVTNVPDLLYQICIRPRCFGERHLLKEPEHSCQDVGHTDSWPHRLSQTQRLPVSPHRPGPWAVLPGRCNPPPALNRPPPTSSRESSQPSKSTNSCLQGIYSLASISSAAYLGLIILLTFYLTFSSPLSPHHSELLSIGYHVQRALQKA